MKWQINYLDDYYFRKELNMIDNISVFHSSIKIVEDKTIYFDPYKIQDEAHDADYIFITHSHYDHYSPEDIEKIINDNTVIIAPQSMQSEIFYDNVIYVVPGEEYNESGICFSTVWAYNVDKHFHPKANMWVGYVVQIADQKVYVAGDTDVTEESKMVKCDIAFIPCGGTYTMGSHEAAFLANTIKPKIAIPTHYGAIVGSRSDGEEFIKQLDSDIQGKILIK